jgi:hypothetical protein
VRMPPLTSMPAISVAPVKSSAMIPRMAMARRYALTVAGIQNFRRRLRRRASSSPS